MPNTPFAVLRQLLLDIGFVEQPQVDRFVRFDHPPSQTWLVYPRIADDDPIDAGNLIGTRGLLNGRGILSTKDFDAELQERIALHHRAG